MPKTKAPNAHAVGGNRADRGGPPRLSDPADTDVSIMCNNWLRLDDRLDALCLEWSRAEVLLSEISKQPPGLKQHLRLLDRRIKVAHIQKSSLFQRIVTSPSRHAEDAMNKLWIIERLLEGEGGPEHQLMLDARLTLGREGGVLPDKSLPMR